MSSAAYSHLTYENFMQLNPDEQLTEVFKHGKPVGVHKDTDTAFTNAVLYQYSHFHVELTFANWQDAKSIVPILVLHEYKYLSERYPEYILKRGNQ